MIGVKRLTVRLNFGEDPIEVGELAEQKRKIYFKYSTDFLKLGIQLSPFKLPLTPEPVELPTNSQDGLLGLFADSLPDGWGRLLLDRTLSERGISISAVTPLDRLAFIGEKGFGALTYHPVQELNTENKTELDLDQIATEIEHVYEGESSEILDQLYTLGGSPGGARPKIIVGYNQQTDQLIYGGNSLPKGFEHWLIKFPASNDFRDIASIEYAYSEMAKAAGIEMADCNLFTSRTGRSFFGTKRFDRNGNNRFHLHSMAGLFNQNMAQSSIDYGHIMDAAFQLEKNVTAYTKVLRLCAFNIYTHNRDDHIKNVAFLMDQQQNWRFAPAYDLTFSRTSHGLHSTTVAGSSKNPGKKELMELANEFDVKHANKLIEDVQRVVKDWQNYAESAGVTSHSKKIIQQEINERLKH